MECPECHHSRFIQARTKAPSEIVEIRENQIPKLERTLSDMHLAILEGLLDQPDFVNASQFIQSLPLENQSMAQSAIMAIQEMVQGGLLEVKGRTKIRITPLGKESYEREKDLP
jgi:hypothetical protein